MNQRKQDVTEAELALLQTLWDEGRRRSGNWSSVSTSRPVRRFMPRCRNCSIGSRPRACVERDRGGSVHVFRAAINRDELIGRRLRAVADSLCGGSLSPLLTHLVEGRGLSERERRELRAWSTSSTATRRTQNELTF